MSTLRANTVLASDGTTTTPVVIPSLDKRFCTAWLSFNGTLATVVPKDAYNVASITDLGTGNFQCNFATPLLNANYSAVATYSNTGIIGSIAVSIKTLTSFTLWIAQIIIPGGTAQTFDPNDCNAVVMGGK